MCNVFKNVIFKRILVIFIIGLVSRSVVNYMVSVNVFTYCINDNIYIYWVFITGFFTIFNDLPSINFKVFNLKLIRNAMILYIEKFKLGDKLICGESLDKDLKISYPNNQLVYTQNNSGGVRRSVSSSGGRSVSSSGGRGYSAGVAGLYGENGRTRRSSAGIKGLYGDNSTRVCSSSTKEYVSNKDKNVRRVGNIFVKRDDPNMINERVSGFNRRNIVDSGVNIDSSNFVDNSQRLSGVKGFLTFGTNENGSTVVKGIYDNPYYVPKELPVSLREGSVYSSSSNNSSKLVAPKAPRPTNYSTPETMSPLFESNSERSSASTKVVVRERGWGSFFSNTPILDHSGDESDNSDWERRKKLHKKCGELSEGISKGFGKRRS